MIDWLSHAVRFYGGLTTPLVGTWIFCYEQEIEYKNAFIKYVNQLVGATCGQDPKMLYVDFDKNEDERWTLCVDDFKSAISKYKKNTFTRVIVFSKADLYRKIQAKPEFEYLDFMRLHGSRCDAPPLNPEALEIFMTKKGGLDSVKEYFRLHRELEVNVRGITAGFIQNEKEEIQQNQLRREFNEGWTNYRLRGGRPYSEC